jgi:hypothetical protein
MPLGGWDFDERELFGNRYLRCRTFLESVIIFATSLASIVWILVALSRQNQALFWAGVPVLAMLAVAVFSVGVIFAKWLSHARLALADLESDAHRSAFRKLALDFLQLYSVCLGTALLVVFMAYAMLRGTR